MPHIEELGTQCRGTRASTCQWPPAWLAPSTPNTVEADPDEASIEDLAEAPGEPAAPGLELAPDPVPTDPPYYPWRQVLAEWPVEWRQAWGELANEYEEVVGLDWREAEESAFADVSGKKAKAEAPAPRRLAS